MKPEVIISLLSLVVAIGAFGLSWSADSRARVAARAQLFLTLRSRFLKVLEDLPGSYMEPDWDASNPDERAAAIRYWQHAFDEWFVTKRLDEKLMHQLWDQFYSEAVLAGLKHKGLRKTLIEYRKNRPEMSQLWKDFIKELDAIWSREHPDDGSKCVGLECDHETEDTSK